METQTHVRVRTPFYMLPVTDRCGQWGYATGCWPRGCEWAHCAHAGAATRLCARRSGRILEEHYCAGGILRRASGLVSIVIQLTRFHDMVTWLG